MNKTATAGVIAAALVLGTVGVTYAVTSSDKPSQRPTLVAGDDPQPLQEGEPVGVVDREGDAVGFVGPNALDQARDRIMERMMAAGIRDTSGITEDEEIAYQIVEAVPVTDADGKVTGYMADQYLSVADYEARRADAERLVRVVEEREGS